MAATAEQVAQLRRMVAEPTSASYTDDVLLGYIETRPVPDSSGRESNHIDWVESYDLNAVAAELWLEKAAAVAGRFDSSTDGASLSRSQLQAHANKMSRRFAARSHVRFQSVAVAPRPEYADETEEI